MILIRILSAILVLVVSAFVATGFNRVEILRSSLLGLISGVAVMFCLTFNLN